MHQESLMEKINSFVRLICLIGVWETESKEVIYSNYNTYLPAKVKINQSTTTRTTKHSK